jgi:CDP-paratose 2-epimerase
LNFTRILITGGAGFVGSNIATMLRQGFANVAVTALDNLRRRGSELNLSRLAEHGVKFVHGDIRCREDIDECPAFDLLIDCSAEPSVQAGVSGSPMGVIQHNLTGTINCIEAARTRGAAFLFLSTSRVYPIEPINAIPFREDATRFRWDLGKPVAGVTEDGVTEQFTLDGARSPYGATKLAVELLLCEYSWLYKMPVLINRCGVLAGPWQMGKVDQGVVTLWVASHLFKRSLKYIGFGGHGKQVRDLLHIEDLYELIVKQLSDTAKWDARPYNVGGGLNVSASLAELTRLCRDATGNTITIDSDSRTSPVDVRIYLTDSSRVSADFAWRPRKSVSDIVTDIAAWARQHESALRKVLG